MKRFAVFVVQYDVNPLNNVGYCWLNKIAVFGLKLNLPNVDVPFNIAVTRFEFNVVWWCIDGGPNVGDVGVKRFVKVGLDDVGVGHVELL